MGRRELRLRRKLTVLALIVLLLLLLELNRFLPGGWPGGGGEGGFRQSDALGLSGEPYITDETRLAPPVDPASIEGLLQALDKDAVLVQVFDARGNELDAWSLGVGEEGAENRTPSKLVHGLRQPEKQKAELAKAGFRVRGYGRLASHMLVGPVADQPIWRVVLPKARTPARRQRTDVPIEIRSKHSGELIAATVAYDNPRDAAAPTEVDAGKGTVTLPKDTPLHVRASTASGRHADAFIHPRQPGPVVIEIDDAPRKTLPGATIHSIRSPDGRLIEGKQAGVSSWPTVGYEPGAWAELHAESAERATIAWGERLEKLGDATMLPEHRHLELLVTDLQGSRMGDAVVRTRYALPVRGFELAEPFFVETKFHCDAKGRAHPAVPTGVDAVLLVDAPGKVPQVFEIGTPTTVLDRVKLAPGRRLNIRVVDIDGNEIENPTVVGRTVVGGMILERDAGHGFPDGPVEVYATAAGYAWGKALVRVAKDTAATRITLVRAKPLNLVVESHLGLPLAGVQIEVTPTDDGEPIVTPPVLRAAEAGDRTNAYGVLSLDRLPDRVYRVRLSLPGYHAETLYRIRPGAVTYFTTLVAQ